MSDRTAPIPTIAHADYHAARDAAENNPAIADSPLGAQKALTVQGVLAGAVQPVGFIAKLKDALGLERKALDAAQIAAKARREAEQLQAQWEQDFVETYNGLAGRVMLATEQIRVVESRVAEAEATLQNSIGARWADSEIAIGCAQRIFLGRGALPILREARDGLQKQLAAHVEKMRTWGKTNGVPKATLDALAL